ncbi:MAG: alpha/beta hydrolase family protein [Chitinophagaceae bacterium]
MKKYLFAAFFVSGWLLISNAQSVTGFAGTWQGTLQVGMDLRIVFHIRDDGKGGYTATADSPDQSAYGLKCDKTSASGNEITITMDDLRASYTGKLVNDTTITGTFIQGAELPLTLVKKEKIEERKRPQTPRPPFPYRSEDIVFSTGDGSLTYGATLTIPEGKGPFPAALLITGSGAQNRDEEIFGHKPFAVIADHLTRKGIIVMRVDDRGVGKSTGNFQLATSADFATDVNNSLDYLLARPETDPKKTGLIGHSEGGMIAPMVAANRKNIAFVILLAGPGVQIIDLMAEQNEAVARSSGVSEKALPEIKPLFREIARANLRSKDSSEAFSGALAAVESWAAGKDPAILNELQLSTREEREKYIENSNKSLQTPWFRYFLAFDPGPYLEKLKCKVLALNGDRDIQVVASQNLQGIEASLKKGRSKEYKVISLPGLNHLFQTCQTCTIREYAQLEETFSPVALNIISDWLEKQLR